MFLLEWTANDLLLMAVAAAAIIGTVLWLVPGAQVPRKTAYTLDEITAYDQHIPRYFLAAAVALVVGGVHIVVKNLPGFWTWLWQAGYGGHLFRDLANSHIIIVGGGTVLLTGITWYVLPRFVNRPLYSTALASASLWFTVIGVFGFYLAWLVLGLVEGEMVRQGWDYLAAKEAVGSWHSVPTRITSSIMGVGYWTYVLNVLLTAWVGRFVTNKPFGYLTKFSVVSALALFVGTVQGVLQVLPANADWIHAAGKFGQYVDPISHAHINLVTGMVVSLAAFLIYFGPRLRGHEVDAAAGKRAAAILFWTLVPGSLAFYFAFLLTGLSLGGYGGPAWRTLAAFLGSHLRLVLALAGSAMFIAFWVYFVYLWRALGWRSMASQVRQSTLAAFWLASSVALVIGTLQGLLQVIPATAIYLTTAEEVPNIHAQLNMIGGVLPALIGLVYWLLPELVGERPSPRLVKRSLYGVAGGIGAYYVATLVLGLVRLGLMQQGMSSVAAAEKLRWIAPWPLLATAVPLLLGFAAFGTAVYRTTPVYRARMAGEIRQAPARFAGPMPKRLRRIPLAYVLGMELLGGLFGWPGLGWLYSGQAMVAVALMLIGPSIAWALLPMLFSPFTDTVFSQWGWHVLLVWLPSSALLSSGLLGLFVLRRQQKESLIAAATAVAGSDGPPPNPKGRARIPRGLVIGIILVLLLLLSVPVIPLLFGLPEDLNPQPVMAELPDRANGAYLDVVDAEQIGLIKLFAWSFPVEEFPAESPAINPAQLRGFTIRQKGLDSPDKYRLFHVDDGHQVPLQAVEVSFQTEMSLRLLQPLEPGEYMLDTPTGGMFAGRDFYYFRIDPTVTALPVAAPPVVAEPAPVQARTAVSWLELFPLSSAVLSGVMALIMANRLRQKVRPHEAAWTVAFAMFAVAAGSQVIGDIMGWSAALARLYYAFGATLVVGWLGLGTWLVIVRKPHLRAAGIWLVLFCSGFALGLIAMTPVNEALLAAEGWGALEKPTILTILTITVNSLGTLVLVGGALWSAWVFWRKGIMRPRMIGLLLLAGGALVVAAGGSLTRFGHEQYLYIAMSLGIGLMFWGYLKTIQPLQETAVATEPRLTTAPVQS